jgi:hypothetical protein
MTLKYANTSSKNVFEFDRAIIMPSCSYLIYNGSQLLDRYHYVNISDIKKDGYLEYCYKYLKPITYLNNHRNLLELS